MRPHKGAECADCLKIGALFVEILDKQHAVCFVVCLPAAANLSGQVLDVEWELVELHDLLKGALELPAKAHNGIPLLHFVHRKPLLTLLRFEGDQVIKVEPWSKERHLFVASEEHIADTLVALCLVDFQIAHILSQGLRRLHQLWFDPACLETKYCCEALILEVDVDHP